MGPKPKVRRVQHVVHFGRYGWAVPVLGWEPVVRVLLVAG